MRSIYTIPLCIAVAAVVGCGNDGLSTEEMEERDPLVRSAVAFADQNQWDEAEKAYKEALDLNPMMAKPHLDLALIYQQYKPDYVHAIYHYDRYLELRPDSEKTAFIKEQREKVMRALQVQAIRESPEWKQIVADAERLMQENAALKQQLSAATTGPRASAAGSGTAPTTPAVSEDPGSSETPSAAGEHQIYTVVAGDTLTKIATQFYGAGADWEPIYEANRDSLSSPSALRVGQTLVIPMPANTNR